MKSSILITALASLSACTSFSEDHFFQSRAVGTAKPTNYFRVRVSGSACLSAARFVSGYYDERAVDLFFNEIKLAGGESTNVTKVFEDQQKDPGTDEVIKPLTPSAQNGTLVMLLSTNARAVADAIGQFAENQLVADAITNIANRDIVRQLREAEASPEFEHAQADAVAKELEALFGLVKADQDAVSVERAYLRILGVIARSRGASVSFDDMAAARAWFASNGGKS
jgi:hypothetical protein